MGISINIAIQLARIAPLLKDCKSGVMLGRQAMHFRPPDWKPRLIASLETLGINTTEEEIFQDDGFCEAYLSKIGWPKMESLDFSDIEGAEYIHDLSYPINENLEQRFDLIYDGGTTEHVFDIASAFRNVDAMLKDGGIFVSCVGADGWFGHGFYQIGPDIPWRMQSFVDAGHKFTLYSTDKLRDLPDGVTLEDPRDIYQADFPTGPEYRHNNAVYADIFRLHMIRNTGAIWADMDAYCLKPFIFPSGFAVGLEEATSGVFTANNGIVGFPHDSKTLNECINLVSQKNPILPFFNGGRRTRLRERTKNGDSFGFQDFSWGTSGPRLIHYFMEATGELKYALPKDVFYPGPRAFRRPLLRPEYASEVFERPETGSVHIFGKTKSFPKDDYGGDLPENCYLDRLCKRHGIDPKAHPV